MYDLIIIGGGPAGLTATIYAIRKRINALMVTKDLGGKTQWRLALPWIEDYQVIRGLEVVDKFKSELEYLDFARRMETVEGVKKEGEDFVVRTSGGELKAKAIIVASGTKQMLLRVPGEKEFMMKGLCYSALSYAPLFIDRTTLVIGDGDLALRSAGELATIAEKVYLVCESSGEMLASPLGQKLQADKKVTILKNQEVVEFRGDDYARKTVLKGKDGSTSELNSDGIFIEKALVPNSQMVADLVELDEEGRIVVDCANRTNEPGVFAAGDVTSGFAEQVLIAVGEGAKAALSAYDYLLPRL